MEYRTLDLKIISAKGLKNVNFISKLEVYAVVTIAGGDPRAKQRTPTDRDGGVNPAWNFPMKFTIDEVAAQQNRLTLVVNLRAERALGDRDVGEVRVPIKEIIGDDNNKAVQFVRYQVRKPNGKAKGELNFSYQFSEKIGASHVPHQASHVTSKADEPVTAYPAVAPMAAGTSAAYPPPETSAYPPVTSSTGYPPAGYPQGGPGYGYPPPQQPGYGYPPQQPGYGYPGQQPGYGYPPQQGYGYAAPVQQPPKKNKFGGGGMGLGLLGGALGGLLIGDMISDVGSYDAGYDAGFDDAGGFDF
ncbi:protein SRC2 homolog [Apium graveolens]|uniref:protein SRC2 homolog n=1 Tax=Apium graveolens TaxID=4045 RepID=UPI003D7A865E